MKLSRWSVRRHLLGGTDWLVGLIDQDDEFHVLSLSTAMAACSAGDVSALPIGDVNDAVAEVETFPLYGDT